MQPVPYPTHAPRFFDPTLVLGAFLALALASALTAGAAAESEWPGWRGPNYEGSSTQEGVFSAEGTGLKVAWKRKLGSGYSAISGAGTEYIPGRRPLRSLPDRPDASHRGDGFLLRVVRARAGCQRELFLREGPGREDARSAQRAQNSSPAFYYTEISEIRMPRHVSPAHLEEPTGRRGWLEEFNFTSKIQEGPCT